MLKKIFIIIIFLFFCSNVVLANSEYVDALETKLFGKTFTNESYSQRVDRIETEIYGKTYIGNSEERLEKIYKIYPKNEILLSSNSSYKNTFQDEQSFYNNDEYNDYPIITMIEEQILLKTYQNEDIYKRLDRLEQKIYGKTKNNLSLSERVDDLKSQIKISKKNRQVNIQDNYSNIGAGYYDNTDNKISNLLQEMEYETFSHSFSYDNTEDRLNRLEKYYFGTYQNNLSEKQRLTKLAKIISKKYDSEEYMKSYKDTARMERNAQWAELIMNLLIIGLGFIL